MTTYVIMQNRIADECAAVSTAAASIYETQIQRSILSAVAYYARRQFYFNTKTGTFSTVDGQEYYSSSDLADIATLVDIKTMMVTLGTTKLPVMPVAFDEIDRVQNGAVEGLPQHFCYFKQNIRLYPMPDAVYTVTMAYVYKPAALSAGSDSNAWTTDAEELIRCRASWDFLSKVRQDSERAKEFKLAELDALSVLERETRKRRSVSLLRQDPAMVARGGYNITYQ